MRVEQCPDPGEEWDAFVEAHAGAHLGHAAGWADVLRESYGLTPHYLVCRGEAGAVEGVLPLFAFRGLLGRRELVSIPFHDVSGVLVRDERAESALLDAALELGRELRCSALELRQAQPLGQTGSSGDAPVYSARVNLVLRLQDDEEAEWKAVRRKVRNRVRKADKEGLQLAEGSPEELLDGFYEPYCVNMRDLGSPAHSRAFFSATARRFGERLRCIVSVDGARPLAGMLAIDFASRITVTWSSALRSERNRGPNYQIYWEALRWAVARGAPDFDFGRSPIGGGTHEFKRGWRAEEHPLAWTRIDRQGERLAVSGAADNPLLAGLSSVWRRLPLGVTRLVGPRIRHFFSS